MKFFLAYSFMTNRIIQRICYHFEKNLLSSLILFFDQQNLKANPYVRLLFEIILGETDTKCSPGKTEIC